MPDRARQTRVGFTVAIRDTNKNERDENAALVFFGC